MFCQTWLSNVWLLAITLVPLMMTGALLTKYRRQPLVRNRTEDIRIYKIVSNDFVHICHDRCHPVFFQHFSYYVTNPLHSVDLGQ